MPLYRFDPYELDSERQQLRLRGSEILLQPKVLDLLIYLVQHQDRVVDKEELLDVVWAGTVVTDASLQRAISLIRSALRGGGQEQAIRTYARRGYRFCPVEKPPGEGCPGLLEQARECVHKGDWAQALECFALADQAGTLDGAALEAWGQAAQSSGALLVAVPPLERSAAAFMNEANPEGAARVAVVLARILLESLEKAPAKGWLRRATQLLESLPDSEQQGHVAWMTARYALVEGDLELALLQARRTIAVGRQHENADLQAMGLLYEGMALQCQGEVSRGMALQDEAAASVLSGVVSPLIGGLVYCGLISGCCNSGDWQRASQWTDAFTRWCDRIVLTAFAGSCVLHRAQVYYAMGQLQQAGAVLLNSDQVLQQSAPWAIGDACRIQGDLHLMRAEFDAAEAAYQRAHSLGCDPYPGYAQLLYQRQQSDAAIRGLQQAIAQTNWAAQERRALFQVHLAIIAAMSGEVALATQMLETLDQSPDSWQQDALTAQVERARAELALVQGAVGDAIPPLRHAVQLLQHKGLLSETAIVRLRLAFCLAQWGDHTGALLELNSARAVLAELGARLYLTQCEALMTRLHARF